eukprot:GHVR01123292.1.p1 GENE.GHVR01123292.1~~GHVR01123292.1.p1  ORF type:complete len:925 (+),score=196.51 GHVR01123292.1:56-2830(+)
MATIMNSQGLSQRRRKRVLIVLFLLLILTIVLFTFLITKKAETTVSTPNQSEQHDGAKEGRSEKLKGKADSRGKVNEKNNSGDSDVEVYRSVDELAVNNRRERVSHVRKRKDTKKRRDNKNKKRDNRGKHDRGEDFSNDENDRNNNNNNKEMKVDKNKRKIEEKKERERESTKGEGEEEKKERERESTKGNEDEQLERKNRYEKKQKRIKQRSEEERDAVIAAIRSIMKERQEKAKHIQAQEEENKGDKDKGDKDKGDKDKGDKDKGDKENKETTSLKSEEKNVIEKSEESIDTERSGTGLGDDRDENIFVTLEDKERESCESSEVGRSQSLSSNKFTVHYNTFSTCNLPTPLECDIIGSDSFKPINPDNPNSKMPVVELTKKEQLRQSIYLKSVNACEDPIGHMCGGLQEDTSESKHFGFKKIVVRSFEKKVKSKSSHNEWEKFTNYLLKLCNFPNALPEKFIFVYMMNEFRELIYKRDVSSTSAVLGAAFARGVNVFMSVRYVPRLSYSKDGQNAVLRLEGAPHDLPEALLNLRSYSQEEKHSWREKHLGLIAELLMHVEHEFYKGQKREQKEAFERRADSLLTFICSMIEHTRENNYHIPRYYHPPVMTNVIELDKACGTQFWSEFFKGVVSVFTDFKMTSETDLEVAGVNTLAVCTLVREVDATTIRDFLTLNIFKALAPFSAIVWQKLATELQGLKPTTLSAGFKLTFCKQSIIETFPLVIATSAIVEKQKENTESNIRWVKEYVSLMKSLMISDIKHLREDKHDANDNLLTKMLTKKVEDIKVDIGYPEELNPNEFLTVMYGDWNKLNEILRGGGNYIISIMPYLLQQKVWRGLTIEYSIMLSRLNNPFKIDPVYYPHDNRLYVPLSLVYDSIMPNSDNSCEIGKSIMGMAADTGVKIVGGILDAFDYKNMFVCVFDF